MFRFASLGSGSKGNATLIEAGKTRILVDCGFALSETTKRLQRLGCEPESLSAILVTHEHGDHAKGVGKLSRRYALPVWTSIGTYHAIKDNDFASYHPISIHQAFSIQGLHIKPFPVPHDAREPCQFIFDNGQFTLGLMTDAGSYTPHLIKQLKCLDALLLECNYDAQMLSQGAYPLSLKQRVAGNYGHLDNQQSLQILQQLDQTRLQHVIGMHLSENNNRPEYAAAALSKGLNCLPKDVPLACQNQGFTWRELH